MIPLWVKRLRNDCWVCSGRYPQPLVVGSSFLLVVLRVAVDLMLSLIFESSALVWVRDEAVVAYPGDALDWRTIDVGGFGTWLLIWISG